MRLGAVVRGFFPPFLSTAGLLACGRVREVSGDIAIVGVSVIDGTDRGPVADQTVVIAGERIAAVADRRKIKPTVGTLIDGRGKYLIPGLWDMHVHLAGYQEHSFPLFLANGVTTIRDVGGDLARSLWLRQETRFGRLLGPDLLISGPILESPFVLRASEGQPAALDRPVAVADSAAAVAIVDSLDRVHIDQIKVHAMTPRAAYFAVIGRAKRLGIPVVGHIPDSVLPREAIESGQRTIEHNSKIELAQSARGPELNRWMVASIQRAIDQAGPKPQVLSVFRYRLEAADSAIASFDSATARAFAELAVEHEVFFDPTLVIAETVLLTNEPDIRRRPELKYAPAEARKLDEGITPSGTSSRAEIEEGRRRWQAFLGTMGPLERAGVKFVAGTDVPVLPLVPGFALHRELRLLTEAGLTPLGALQAATRNAAEAAGKLGRTGTVEEGKTASLVLLDADPLRDIANTTRIRAVMSRGRLLDRATLDRMLVDAEAFAKTP